jgi:hypothetical protein
MTAEHTSHPLFARIYAKFAKISDRRGGPSTAKGCSRA